MARSRGASLRRGGSLGLDRRPPPRQSNAQAGLAPRRVPAVPTAGAVAARRARLPPGPHRGCTALSARRIPPILDTYRSTWAKIGPTWARSRPKLDKQMLPDFDRLWPPEYCFSQAANVVPGHPAVELARSTFSPPPRKGAEFSWPCIRIPSVPPALP